jgi:hypothetical protein
LPEATADRNPGSPSDWYGQLEAKRRLPRALMEGTPAMRALGEERLPRFALEDPGDYGSRLGLAVLDPSYPRAVRDLVGKVFAKEIALGPDVPVEIRGREAAEGIEPIEGWAENIDNRGANLHAFLKQVFQERLAEGLAGVLVDAPPMPPGLDPERVSLADMEGRRPYWVLIRAAQILDYDEVYERGETKLSMLRYSECRMERTGPLAWSPKRAVHYVRVLYRGQPEALGVERFARIEVHRKGEDGKWSQVPEESHPMQPLTEIPFEPFPGLNKCDPPLATLADLNAKHWRVLAEFDAYSSAAQRVVWFWSGVDDVQLAKCQNMGGFFLAWHTKPPGETDLKTVETSGSAPQLATSGLDRLEASIREESLRPLLTEKAQTLGETVLDTKEAESALQTWALELKNGGENLLMHTAAWRGIEWKPNRKIGQARSGGSLTVNLKYALTQQQMASLDALRSARQGVHGVPDLSRRTLWASLQMQESLPPDFSAEDEEARLAAESGGATAELEDLREQIAELRELIEARPAPPRPADDPPPPARPASDDDAPAPAQ